MNIINQHINHFIWKFKFEMLNKKDTIDAVIINFLAILKDYDYYVNFARIIPYINNTGIIGMFRYANVNYGIPFSDCKDIEDISDKLFEMTSQTFCGEFNEKTLPEFITLTINTLLHFFIERQNRDFDFIGKIGQETYNLTCKKLIGSKFVEDEENMTLEQAKTIEEARSVLFNEYMKAKSNGDYEGDFGQFFNDNIERYDNWKEVRNVEETSNQNDFLRTLMIDNLNEF